MATGRWYDSEASSDPSPVGRHSSLTVVADEDTVGLPATGRWHHADASALAGSTAYGRWHAIEADALANAGTASGIFELRGGRWVPLPLWQLRAGAWQ